LAVGAEYHQRRVEALLGNINKYKNLDVFKDV
jgi:hypothetical protein